MAYQSGVLPNLFTGLSRKRALTGRSLSRQEMSGLIGPVLDYDVAKANAAGEREQRQRELDRQYELQRKAQSDASGAAEVSGIAQLAGLGASSYLEYQGNQATLAKIAAQKEFNAGLLKTMSPSTPAVGAGSSGLVPPPGAAGASAPSIGATLSDTPAIATSAADASYMAETGLADAGAEGAGLFSGASSAIGPAALGGGIGSYLGGKVADKIGIGEDGGQALGGALGGALAGAMATSWSGPGALVGAAVGAVVSLFDDLF